MSDIVERLRHEMMPAAMSATRRAILEDAADEIERLRQEGTVELAKAMLEIERLTAREEQRAERLRLYMNRIGELEADNERLLAALHGIMEATDLDEVGVIARRALEPKP
jgi:hypothetical protein